MASKGELLDAVREVQMYNLQLYKYLTTGLVENSLVPQVEVEFDEYKRFNMELFARMRDPNIPFVKKQEAQINVFMADVKKNDKLRRGVTNIQRSLVARCNLGQPIPMVDGNMILQDFPELCVFNTPFSVPLTVLCDLILHKYNIHNQSAIMDTMRLAEEERISRMMSNPVPIRHSQNRPILPSDRPATVNIHPAGHISIMETETITSTPEGLITLTEVQPITSTTEGLITLTEAETITSTPEGLITLTEVQPITSTTEGLITLTEAETITSTPEGLITLTEAQPITSTQAGLIELTEAQPITSTQAGHTTEIHAELIIDTLPEVIEDVQAEPITDTLPEVIMDNKAEPITDTLPEVIADVQAEPITDTLPEVFMDNKAEPITDTLPEVIMDNKAEPITDTLPEVIADVQAEPITDTLPEVFMDTQAEFITDTLPEVFMNVQAEPITDTLPEVIMDNKAKPITDTLQEVIADVQAEPITDTLPEVFMDTQAESITDTLAEPITETKAELVITQIHDDTPVTSLDDGSVEATANTGFNDITSYNSMDDFIKDLLEPATLCNPLHSEQADVPTNDEDTCDQLLSFLKDIPELNQDHCSLSKTGTISTATPKCVTPSLAMQKNTMYAVTKKNKEATRDYKEYPEYTPRTDPVISWDELIVKYEKLADTNNQEQSTTQEITSLLPETAKHKAVSQIEEVKPDGQSQTLDVEELPSCSKSSMVPDEQADLGNQELSMEVTTEQCEKVNDSPSIKVMVPSPASSKEIQKPATDTRTPHAIVGIVENKTKRKQHTPKHPTENVSKRAELLEALEMKKQKTQKVLNEQYNKSWDGKIFARSRAHTVPTVEKAAKPTVTAVPSKYQQSTRVIGQTQAGVVNQQPSKVVSQPAKVVSQPAKVLSKPSVSQSRKRPAPSSVNTVMSASSAKRAREYKHRIILRIFREDSDWNVEQIVDRF